VHFGVLELDREQIAADGQLGDRDNQDQDAAWFDPPEGALKEERFESFPGARVTGSDVIGRVLVKKAARLNATINIKTVAVNDLIQSARGFFRPKTVQLDAAALALGALRNSRECLTFTRARVEYGETGSGIYEVLADASGFGLGEREVRHSESGTRACHAGPPEQFLWWW